MPVTGNLLPPLLVNSSAGNRYFGGNDYAEKYRPYDCGMCGCRRASFPRQGPLRQRRLCYRQSSTAKQTPVSFSKRGIATTEAAAIATMAIETTAIATMAIETTAIAITAIGATATEVRLSALRLLWRLWLSLLASRYQSLVRFLTQEISSRRFIASSGSTKPSRLMAGMGCFSRRSSMHLRRACKAHQLYGPGEDGETNPALPLTPDVLDPSTGEIDPVGLFRPKSPATL